MSDKCNFCNGTGYQSAAQNMPKDTPSILMPIGTWPCPSCNGTGKAKEIILTEEDHKKFKELLGNLDINQPTNKE